MFSPFIFSPAIEAKQTRASTYYTAEDFACRCGCGFNAIDNQILTIMGKITEAHKQPLVITSGCRCRKYNAEIGGASRSYHLQGKAVDIACTDSRRRYSLVKLAINFGITGIGVRNNFLHFDIRKDRCFWIY